MYAFCLPSDLLLKQQQQQQRKTHKQKQQKTTNKQERSPNIYTLKYIVFFVFFDKKEKKKNVLSFCVHDLSDTYTIYYSYLFFVCWDIFHAFGFSGEFFNIHVFEKFFQCQTVWARKSGTNAQSVLIRAKTVCNG